MSDTVKPFQGLVDTSTRIREYEAAAHVLEGLARLSTDSEVRADLRGLATHFHSQAAEWTRRLDADLIATAPSAVDPTTGVKK